LHPVGLDIGCSVFTISPVTSGSAWKLLFATLFFFVCGCASAPGRSAQVDPQEPLFRLFQRRQYAECIQGIEANLTPKMSRHQKAELLLLEGMCREEMNQPGLADQVYRAVIQSYRKSDATTRASRRLKRLESDQREHFGIEFAPGDWQRLDKEWNESNFRERYLSKADSRETIIILAKDRSAEQLTIPEALSAIKAVFEMDAREVKLRVLKETSSDALFEFEVSNPGRVKRDSINGEVQIGMKIRRGQGIGRVLVTSDRMNVILYSNAGTLSESGKARWTALLQNARLKTATSAAPDQSTRAK
jgi:hypothetical protein